jgi:hypothetical protein
MWKDQKFDEADGMRRIGALPLPSRASPKCIHDYATLTAARGRRTGCHQLERRNLENC